MSVTTSAQIRIFGNTAVPSGGVTINCGNIVVAASAAITGTGLGFPANQGPGKGFTTSVGSGAGHGGSYLGNFAF